MTIPTLKNILFVEDEPDIQKVIKFSLEKIGGFNVRACSSGREALIALSEFIPDLILMDVMMPGMDGPTTFGEVKKIPECSNIPVVFITAKVQTTEIKRYKDLGVLDIIVKPFEPVNLPEIVKNIWTKQYE